MQTFLPYAEFTQSAFVLDHNRLRKQREEVLEILTVLSASSQAKVGYSNHPAIKMWRGYTNALVYYGACCCTEWENRGNDCDLADQIDTYYNYSVEYVNPPWLGREDIHSDYRATLLGKAPEHYEQFGWSELLVEKFTAWPV